MFPKRLQNKSNEDHQDNYKASPSGFEHWNYSNKIKKSNKDHQ